MSSKKCEKGRTGEADMSKKYVCGKCGAASNKKKKLCKPKENI